MVPSLVALTRRWGFAGATRAAAGALLVVLVPLAWVMFGRRAPVTGNLAARSLGPLGQRRYWGIAAPFALALAGQVGFLNQQLSILAPWLGAGRAALAVSVTAAIRDAAGSYRPALAACIAPGGRGRSDGWCRSYRGMRPVTSLTARDRNRHILVQVSLIISAPSRSLSITEESAWAGNLTLPKARPVLASIPDISGISPHRSRFAVLQLSVKFLPTR